MKAGLFKARVRVRISVRVFTAATLVYIRAALAGVVG